MKISETLGVSLKEALDMFYRSETCRRFHDEETGLYLQGNIGTICTSHQIPCDSVQRRLLSIKMAVFMDGVYKNELLSTKRAVFMDKM